MKLHLNGFVTTEDGMSALSPTLPKTWWGVECIARSVEKFAGEHGWVRNYIDGLGGTKTILHNANLRIYATDKECSLEEAENCLIRTLYGDMTTDIALEGYSEYTITGYCLEDFSIGGHDLEQELISYMGKYIHFILEV